MKINENVKQVLASHCAFSDNSRALLIVEIF
jgi:hypothetical protein